MWTKCENSLDLFCAPEGTNEIWVIMKTPWTQCQAPPPYYHPKVMAFPDPNLPLKKPPMVFFFFFFTFCMSLHIASLHGIQDTSGISCWYLPLVWQMGSYTSFQTGNQGWWYLWQLLSWLACRQCKTWMRSMSDRQIRQRRWQMSLQYRKPILGHSYICCDICIYIIGNAS